MTALSQFSPAAMSADWAFKQMFKLESECRTQVPATQVHAVGQFPKLFDQFPFPTLVNSAFLKLGDLFRGSSNTLRYHIAQVFESSKHHLPQITHTEELLKRILVVLYSNDPVARALALRLLGNGSVVFARYPEAQHGVLLRFQSTHPLEIASAVQTTERMLKYSPEFLSVVWETVIAKASDTQMLDTTRTQLIHSLRHAASNLQLCTVLYDHCRSWMSHPESTAIVQNATMATWKAIIQRHNELRLEDAEFISCLVQSRLSSTCHAALALLDKWVPKDQISDMGADETIDGIRDRLVSLVRLQFRNSPSDIDMYRVRLALKVLAKIEGASSEDTSPGVPESWELAEALCAWSRGVYHGSVPGSLPILEFIHKSLAPGGFSSEGFGMRSLDSDHSAETGASLTADRRLAGTDKSNTEYHRLVSSTLLAMRVSALLGRHEYKVAAAECVMRAWHAISRASLSLDNGRFTKRFLRASWNWCLHIDKSRALAGAIKDMLSSPNECIIHSVANIVASGSLSDRGADEQLASTCAKHISGFISVANDTEVLASEQRSIWASIVVVLIQGLRADIGLPRRAAPGDSVKLAADAIASWSARIGSQQEGSESQVALYAVSGPPAHLWQRVLCLLAANGIWSSVSTLCGATPVLRLGNQLQTWIRAVGLFADAECAIKDPGECMRLADSSLANLGILDRQKVPRRFQLFIVQLRREMIDLLHGWRRFCAGDSLHPSCIVSAKSLVERTRELEQQARLITHTFMMIDSTTRRWLGDVQSAFAAISASASGNDGFGAHSGLQRVADIRGSIGALIKDIGTEPVRLGSSFFSMPPNPEMSIETSPDMEGAESAVAVFSGTQFHLVVEGFLQVPKHRLAAAPARILVAAWLSRQPRRSTDDDLLMCARYAEIAQKASRFAAGASAEEDITECNEVFLWESAILFETKLDGLYFECPCVIPTPSLQQTFGNYDTNIVSHVHIYCALVDGAGRTWWIGPHKSYPLIISTTAKS
ncbi:hypothetical protein LPJ56_000938 [Coemansia sp. RSA 2599]|nr:hypothetical protein LPJ56_000938 [Coemansia sp. RSA 2599]